MLKCQNLLPTRTGSNPNGLRYVRFKGHVAERKTKCYSIFSVTGGEKTTSRRQDEGVRRRCVGAGDESKLRHNRCPPEADAYVLEIESVRVTRIPAPYKCGRVETIALSCTRKRAAYGRVRA